MSLWNQCGFQDASSPTMEEFIFFHDYIMIVLIFTMSAVGVMMGQTMKSSWLHGGLVEGQILESVWTLAPALILVTIAAPSLCLLYSLDDASASSLTLKVMGHQWYWSYEFEDFWRGGTCLELDSFMQPLSSPPDSGLIRLLDVDNRPVLPFCVPARVLVSSADVLHSWALPSLGVKVDANPGRLNQANLMSYRPGLAYGQCSEICGANHSFMPISLEFVGVEDFLFWVNRS